MKKLMRFISFILSKIIWITLIIVLCIAGFTISMNYTNLYVMINDGMKERSNVILYNGDTSVMSKYYTSHFMETDEYLTLREIYSKYNINTYGYNLECDSLFTWPWANTATVYVNEALYSIDGSIDTSIYDRDQAMLNGTYYPPEWKNSRYKVSLVKSDGKWLIDRLEIVSPYDYSPPTQVSLSPEELEALRPTPTPMPSTSPTITPRPLTTPTATATPDPTYKGVVIGVKNSLNVRSGPGTGYDKVGILKNGDIVDIYTLNENWYCINYDGQKAYVHKQYISVEEIE